MAIGWLYERRGGCVGAPLTAFWQLHKATLMVDILARSAPAVPVAGRRRDVLSSQMNPDEVRDRWDGVEILMTSER